jgi:nicotinate phosphoribosyltransferase
LIEQVMQGGKRLKPSPSLDEIRRHAKRELERLPEPLRRLETGMTYPVEIADELKELAAEVDRRTQEKIQENMAPPKDAAASEG